MNEWSLSQIFAGLHNSIEQRLETMRKTLQHPGTKGDASENAWLQLFQTYLPQHYTAVKAHIVDSRDQFSDQIDVVVFDRQYSSFIFQYEGQTVIPAESVYAVFEAKQTISAGQVEYARKKVASVRRLHRTSLPIPHAGGTFAAKPLIPTYGRMLALDSEWTPALGAPLLKALAGGHEDDRLNFGCVAAQGYFDVDETGSQYEIYEGGKPVVALLFKLISQLQFSGTVPMIDVQAYAKWLSR